ncbi:MAG TPA: 50S ribosomal protein L22 [Candidatus Parcubacteria bacterium]|nr:50S ribosomal protein L22 [Candidatus Parcubacteria bacterium]
MKKVNPVNQEEHLARAKANNLSISTKHSVEICRYLRYKDTTTAKKILEETIALKRAIPFKRYNRDVGHKPGIAAGRYPQKAAQEILKLIKTVEANAQFKGLNTSQLKITKILANKASIPLTGSRFRHGTKRTHLEIEVMEKKKEAKRKKTKEENKKKEEKTNKASPKETEKTKKENKEPKK